MMLDYMQFPKNKMVVASFSGFEVTDSEVESIVCAYNDGEFTGMFDLGAVDALHMTEKQDV